MTHLFDRICWAHENLARFESEFVVVYEDGDNDGRAKILVPAPEWMAMALHGGLLPPVAHYHDEQRTADGTFCGPANYWSSYEPIGPLTEEQALAYLILKDVPKHVWAEGSNHPLIICRRDQLPKTRVYRNAWRCAVTDNTIPTYIQLGDEQVDASKVEVPESRVFRGAWVLEGEAIVVDMDLARDIARDKIRAEREPLLRDLDIQYQRNTEAGPGGCGDHEYRHHRGETEAARRPGDSRIDAAQDPESLEMAMNTIIDEMKDAV